MLLEELKPNTEYATLSGNLVRTVDSIQLGFTLLHRHGELVVARRSTTNPSEQMDQWAHLDEPDLRVRVVIRDGIRVFRCDFSDAGVPDGTRTETVIRPDSIRMPWAEYVRLNPDRIVARRRVREAKEASRLFRILAEYQLEQAGVSEGVSVSAPTQWYDKFGDDAVESETALQTYALRPSVTFSGEAVNTLFRLLGQNALAIPGPAEPVDRAAIGADLRFQIGSLRMAALAPDDSVCAHSDLLVSDCALCISGAHPRV